MLLIVKPSENTEFGAEIFANVQMGEDEDFEDASRLAKWVEQQFRKSVDASEETKGEISEDGKFTVSLSDMRRWVFGGSRSVDEVGKLINKLCDRNYLRPVEDAPTEKRRGRKPSPRFEVNPAILEDQPPIENKAPSALDPALQKSQEADHASTSEDLSQNSHNSLERFTLGLGTVPDVETIRKYFAV